MNKEQDRIIKIASLVGARTAVKEICATLDEMPEADFAKYALVSALKRVEYNIDNQIKAFEKEQ